MSKSFVTVEQAICPVCGVAHDTGALLLDRRMRDTFEPKTATHYNLCSEHKKMNDEGYVALVECSNQPTKLEDAVRTGQIAHVRRVIFDRLFNMPAPNGPLAFVEIGVIEKIQQKMQS